MKLPRPRNTGEMSLETTITMRRTVRSFKANPITLDQFSQLLWAAQGITTDKGYFRAAASAGALYPMDIYAVLGKNCVQNLDAGVYHYEPGDHSISALTEKDIRNQLAQAALSQMWMASAPVSFIITAGYDRITFKYGKRGIRYAMIEAGHIGQNIFLQSEALGLGAGIVGAFTDKEIVRVVGSPPTHEPLLIMPVGHKR